MKAITRSTTLKLDTAQSSALPPDQLYKLTPGSYNIAAFAPIDNHYRVTFGKDNEGKQISFTPADRKPRNTWLIWHEHVDIFDDEGRNLTQATKERESILANDTTRPTILRFEPLGRRDSAGCLQYRLSWEANGVAVDSLIVLSGAPGSSPVHPRNDYAGSMRPIPEGVYTIGDVCEHERSWGAGIGPYWIPVTPLERYNVNSRSAIGIHCDYNRHVSPGSAGCICTYTLTDMERIAAWCRAQSRPYQLVVNQGFGFLADMIP